MRDKILYKFFKNGVIAFVISSITINIFDLMKLTGTDIVSYLAIKFLVCFLLSLYVGLGYIVAEILFDIIKKNVKNEQLYWCIR